MKTFYLIDFENVHNDGIANIESMKKEEHVHIFSTQNATQQAVYTPIDIRL